MKIELSNSDIRLLRTALNYVALSLDGNLKDIDNSQIDNVDKLQTMGKCFYFSQLLGYASDTIE